MKVLVIGANGNTGTRVIRRLANGHHNPVAMIRNPADRAKFDSLGVPTILADLEYPIDHAVQGCDAIIFAAGSGGKTGKDKTVLIDHIGAIRSMVAAQVHDVRRYIMLSPINNDINSQSPIAHYHRAKAHADKYLVETDLDYTIVCPGGLTDEPGTDLVTINEKLQGSGMTSRENLASALVACL
ncbi:MAG: SDR family oxidoreductase, partial [Proteobacteria bacterium]|nr:SDR family oxidoreductase [Pseudomonadota bacterium]